MCERRSRVTGSTVWYSSSMPSEKDGRMGDLGTAWRNYIALRAVRSS
jgi:hypothetical protein